MEPQQKYVEQIEQLYRCHDRSTNIKVGQLLQQIGTNQQNINQLLDQLNETSTLITAVNLETWLRFMRRLIRLCQKHPNSDVLAKVAEYVVKGTNYYVPFEVTLNNYKSMQKLIKLSKELRFSAPQLKRQHSKKIIYYLQNELNENWQNELIQYINNQVLVDKKNQNPQMLKINPFFAKFISKKFNKFVQQIERLMIRSQNNIQVIIDFLSACGGQLTNIGPYAVNFIKKYKNLYLSKPQPSLKFITLLTQSLNQQQWFYQGFDFIRTLITAEHNIKKKIIYFRMLEGIVNAQKKYHHSDKIVNEIICCVIVSWTKFIEEEEANYVLELLDKVLPVVSNPGPQIAELCKQSLKSTNKYILICMALTLSYCYKNPSKLAEYSSLKQCIISLKKLYTDLQKKKQSSWYYLIAIINFISTFQLDFVEVLLSRELLFKKSCLSLLSVQQKDALELIVHKYLKFVRNNGEGKIKIVEDKVWMTVAILMENNNRRDVWTNIGKELDDFQKQQIIEKGIYPLIYLQTEPIITKNKSNQYISLIRYLLLSLKQKLTTKDEITLQKILSVASYANIQITKILHKPEQKMIQKIAKKYLLFSLLTPKQRQENQKLLITTSMHDLHIKITNTLFQMQPSPTISFINEIFTKLLDKKYYEKDRTFAQDFDKINHYIKNQHFQLIVTPCKQILMNMQMYNEVKITKKKIYHSTLLFDSKMMSEAEVKEEQYREHFSRMLRLFNAMISILLTNISHAINNSQANIWNTNINRFIHIVEYAEHRMPVYRIVRASFEHFAMQQVPKDQYKQYSALKKLFLRFSTFFGDFYSIRGAHLTPPLALMQKSQKFFTQFLVLNFTLIPKNSFAIRFINDLSLYILENMEFDLIVKEEVINYFSSCIVKKEAIQEIDQLYALIVKNINIVSNSNNIETVLYHCMKNVDSKKYGNVFVEILNYSNPTKILILKILLKVCQENNHGDNCYEPTFEDYIKLRILAFDDSADEQISKPASALLTLKQKHTQSISTTIANFEMKTFVKNNTKDTIEKLCKFMKQSINPQNIDNVFNLVLKTAQELYNENFDQQGLQFLPYFLSLNIDIIPQKYLHKIFEIFVLKYTANEQHVTLSTMSVDTGIDIIKKHAQKSGEKMLLSMESFLSKAKGISNVVFLGVLAPYLKGNKNLSAIEKRITELFKGENQTEQRAIAKCMPDLMSFFKNPNQIVSDIFNGISKIQQKTQSGQSYLASGLLKGLGAKQTMTYLEKLIAEDYPSKNKQDKFGRIYLLRAFVENFGRVAELKGFRIIEILLHYMSDSNEEIRNLAKSVAQIFVIKMSSFSIRELLPHLLSGLENQQNWRIKISYIWILGIMANCSAKQLQTSLPIIVPTLSGCLSNAHPSIREKASEALNLIGETIKNPEISQSIDVIIEALENPFEKSDKAIQILLKTRFNHYIDPPSLSVIVPIIDYCLRGRVSELKEGACQVMGSISELILNPSDMLPYLRYVGSGIKTALTDPLPEIRSIAAMAIGKISSKIGPQATKQYFSFIYELIDSQVSNTTEKTGAAQAFASVICSQDYDYFEESLNQIFNKLAEPTKTIPKEGYILTFLYIPGIRRQEFQGFIKQVNQNTYCYVSDEDEALRNSSMQVSKVLINNYGISHTNLLLQPLCLGIFESNWRKRNAALILLGELLNILKSYMFNSRNYDKSQFYYNALMAVYIMKDDQLEMPRVTATQVWNAYIENTPKTIKSGLPTLVRMWTKHTHAAGGVVFKNIVGFTSKYGENYFSEILEQLKELCHNQEYQQGVFDVLAEFFKRMTQQFLSKPVYKNLIRSFFDNNVFKVDGNVRQSLTRCISLYVEKMHEQQYFESLIHPKIDEMSNLNEENPQYTQTLHLIKDLLNTTSLKILERLIKKITQPFLSQFKIEVITNNADKIANNLYSSFKIPATESMLDEIITLINQPNKANRLALLVYCLDQVSVKLSQKYKNMYIEMLIKQLRLFRNKREQVKDIYFGVIEKFLEMLAFFLNSIELSEIDSLEQLIGEISPHIFDGTDTIKAYAHRIFILMISDHKTLKTRLYCRQMIVSLENQHSTYQNMTIWKDEETVNDYIGILVKGLVYGNNENIEDNIEMTKFLLKNADIKIIASQIPRILGPLIRVSSYQLYQRQKQKLLQFIKQLYCQQYHSLLEVYNYQVVSVCLRILTESIMMNKKNVDLTDEVSKCLFYVITKQSNPRNRQLMLNFILEKAKGAILAKIMCKLLDEIIRENQQALSLATYTKIKSNFINLLQSSESKVSVQGLYFLSKTVAMISVLVQKESGKASQVVTFEDLLQFLLKAYYRKQAIPKISKVEVLLKQSPREKVFYILKCIHECCLANTRTEEVQTGEYVRSLVAEAISGFEDIVEMFEYFD